MCKGKVRIMIDVKPNNPQEWFISEIENVLVKYDLESSVYYIRNDIKKMCAFGKFGFRMQELPEMINRYAAGVDISSRYYLFDHGNRINAESANWCQKKRVDICASVNAGHYKLEWNETGARRDIDYLLRCGVTAFQIDSQYDDYFERK